MKVILVFFSALSIAVSALSAEIYTCNTNQEASFIHLKSEGGRRPMLTAVKWGNLFALTEQDVKNTDVKYSREQNELVVRSSNGNGDSFHLLLKKDQYLRLQNLDAEFTGQSYTSNARGFVWVSPVKIHCFLRKNW